MLQSLYLWQWAAGAGRAVIPLGMLFFSSGAGSILIPVAFVSSCLKAFASSLPAGRPYRGKPSDMWALGVVLFTMLYGQFPFYDSIPQELFRKIKAAEYTIPE